MLMKPYLVMFVFEKHVGFIKINYIAKYFNS
jgi:hypothetical protein